ncbi:MAG: PD-(D/E)XK nuclease family protein, partial [Clostridium sp.]
ISIEEKLDNLENIDSNCQYDGLLQERLNYQYAFEEATRMPTVISVTHLKEAHNKAEVTKKALKAKVSEVDETAADYFEDEYIANIYGGGSEEEGKNAVSKLMQTPLFLQEKKGLTSAEIGTAYHNVMQRIELQEEVTKESIKKQINDLVEKELMTFEAAKEVKVTRIFNFFNSDMGERVIEAYRSGSLKRELPFRVEIPSTRIYDNLDKEKYENEKLLLRGVIDCYFDDGEEGVIIDYKTDYAPEDKIEEIKERYKVQLDYYSEAVRDAFKKKKVRKYLYLFSSNKFLEIE